MATAEARFEGLDGQLDLLPEQVGDSTALSVTTAVFRHVPRQGGSLEGRQADVC